MRHVGYSRSPYAGPISRRVPAERSGRGTYQGRALWSAPARRARRIRPGWWLVGALLVLAPGFLLRGRILRSGLYRSLTTVRQVEVRGTTYLSESEVRALAGLDRPVDFLRADLARAERRLARAPRLESAHVGRELPRRIVIRVVERRPVCVVRAGRLLECDPWGVILPSLVSGVVADVPLVTGVRVRDARPGQRVEDPAFARALRHLAALGRPEIGLAHPVSGVDVSDPDRTVVTLGPDGIDVILPADPPGDRQLSALRVVLADLASRGLSASTIDLTGEDVIPVHPVPAVAAADSLASDHPNPRRG